MQTKDLNYLLSSFRGPALWQETLVYISSSSSCRPPPCITYPTFGRRSNSRHVLILVCKQEGDNAETPADQNTARVLGDRISAAVNLPNEPSMKLDGV